MENKLHVPMNTDCQKIINVANSGGGEGGISAPSPLYIVHVCTCTRGRPGIG